MILQKEVPASAEPANVEQWCRFQLSKPPVLVLQASILHQE